MIPKIDYINGTVEDFTVVLSNRNLDKQGQILNVQDFRCKCNLNSADEISFSVYKYVDGVETNLWNEIKNLKIVWVKELDTYFETRISLAESTNTVKKITGISLCEAELSQTPIRNTEINSEDDIARPDYVVTKFYNPDNKEGSLLHRILSVVPHYSIKYVDKSLWNIQRTFSIDGTTVYDFLMGELSEQIGCLFQFNSKDRSISVYDLCTVCSDCGYRGEYLDVCPECGGTNLYSYGEDTTIFVSADNLTDEVTFDTDVDSIKNCMYLKTGDEIMDAAVIACNSNGSAYLYYFSEEQKADMPEDLRNGLADYDTLVESYAEEYQTLSEELYDCIDQILYYQSGMMPTVEIPEVNATTEVAKLTEENLNPIGLSMVNAYTSTATVNSALKNYAKVFVKSGFVKIEIETGEFTYIGTDDNGFGYGDWMGSFKVTNYSDEEDIAYSETITIDVTGDYETFLNQKVLKNIASNNTDDDSVYDVLNINDLDKFKEALTLYSYNRLESFADAIQGVINVLIEENQGQSDSTYYGQMYLPYYEKLQTCQAEMNTRSATIQELEDRQANILKQQKETQDALNMRTCLGEDLYLLFCAYRREDTYQNENFISDGLTNAEIFAKAKEFIELAKREIIKSGEHQHSISTNLYNLLLMKEFAPIRDKFELGNWIRCKVDDNIYRLRLVSYEVNGNSLSNINTEFSELTKTASGVNDVRSILSKAQSMATSYQYVSKQSEQGQKAQDELSNIKSEGLNSALINIKNNDNEEVTYGKHGILCRSWDDVEADYSPEQLRITHNILAFTRTAWKDCSLALGKHDYAYYDEDGKLVKATGFGLNCDYLLSGYVWGSQIVGGEIYSENYSSTSGTFLDLNKGSFSFAGGKMKLNEDGYVELEGKLSSLGTSLSNQTIKSELASGGLVFYEWCMVDVETSLNDWYEIGRVNLFGNKNATGTHIYNEHDCGIGMFTRGKALGLGSVENDTSSIKYYLNMGLNPSNFADGNYTERHIFNGSTRFISGAKTHLLRFLTDYTNSDDLNSVDLYNSMISNCQSIISSGGLYANGDIGCTGTKYRVVETEHYGSIGMSAYETTEPYFSDLGSGIISDNGTITIFFDPVFEETIDVNADYQVFITQTSEKTISWVEKFCGHFIVHGEVGAYFDWMISCKQKTYSSLRMENVNIKDSSKDEGEFVYD